MTMPEAIPQEAQSRESRPRRTVGTGASVWSVLGLLLVLAVATGGDLGAFREGPLTSAAQVAEAGHRASYHDPRGVVVAAASPRLQQPAATDVPLPSPRRRDLRCGGLPMPRAPDLV